MLSQDERTSLASRAADVLRGNDTGSTTRAAPDLYPHQWSWDAGFNAVGLARLGWRRAAVELDSLLSAQWRTGMVPHIVFDPAASDYFPGPDRWACAELTPDAPAVPRTSGICQPPVHAIAALHVLAAAERAGDGDEGLTWLASVHPRLLAWHRFLARERRDPGTGLLQIFHGWESGLDNSPRWDAPYAAVQVGAGLPPYTRRDTRHVADAAQRPTDEEYDRYLWLVEEAKAVGYAQARLQDSSSFRVGDVLFTAVYAAAGDVLADLATRLGRPQADELRAQAEAARAAVRAAVDPASGLAMDVDLLTGQVLRTETVAGFAPLVAGGLPDAERQRLVDLLTGPRWAGHPRLRWPLPPSTSPESAAFRPRAYWRGPVWPVMTWLLGWSLERDGAAPTAAALREASLDQLAEGSFGEYYEPFTGEPLGSSRQSWTAAVALDWLAGD